MSNRTLPYIYKSGIYFDKTKSFIGPKFNKNLNILTNSTSIITSEAQWVVSVSLLFFEVLVFIFYKQNIVLPLQKYWCSHGKANNSGFLQSTVVPTIYHTLYSNPQIHSEKGSSLPIHSRSFAFGWAQSYDFRKLHNNQLYLHRCFLWTTNTACSSSDPGLCYQCYGYDHYYARNHIDPQSNNHFQAWNPYRSTR